MYLSCFARSKYYARDKTRERKELVIEERYEKVFVKLIKSFYFCLFKNFNYVISNIYQFVF